LLRRKRFWFGLAISLGFLAVFFLRTDLGDIQDAFAGANFALAFAAIPLYFLGFWIRTMRWHYILRPVNDVSTLRLYPVVLIGLMANNVAPARVGELVRAYVLGERESMSKSTALGTIAVDRAFDGLTLVAMLGIVGAFSGNTAGVKLLGVLTAVLFALATLTLACLALSVRARSWLSRQVHRLPESIEPRVTELMDSFMTGLAAIRSPTALAKAGCASVASWTCEATMYYIIGQAFDLGVGFHVYLLIVAAANLALSILASPGGIGPFEVATKQVLLSFGVADAAATAYALALHILLLGPVILVGFVLLWSTEFSLSEILGVRKTTRGNVLPAPPAPE
jgi:uncharacterized protein (TIRG00374 family)